jgi:hypothetical protein
MKNDHFEVLLLIGRPASGKSEIIQYLKSLPPSSRLRTYHVGDLVVLDDFPMLWTWFEEDHILSRSLGQPRLFTDEEGYFNNQSLWDLLIERLGLEYHKLLRDQPSFPRHGTVIIEFSRGSEHGGYLRAFQHLPVDVLEKAGILYVDVSFDESLRKNRQRYNPNRPDSVLEHSLPDSKLERLYKSTDWEQIIAGQPGVLEIRSVQVPFVVFENEDDVTTGSTEKMALRLKERLDQLWKTCANKSG